VWAYDFALRRITLYPQWDATPIVHSLEQPPPTLGAAGRLADGSYVLAQYWGVGEPNDVISEGLRRDPAAIVRYDADGRFLDTLGMFKAREVYIVTEDGRPVMGSPLFGRTLSRAAAGHAVFVGDQERWVIERYAPDGRLEMVVRMPDADLSIGADELAAAKDARVAAIRPERRAAMRAYLDATEHPPTKPAYHRFLVDAAGNLWVGEYRVDTAPSRQWQIIAPDGRWLGTVTIPEGFKPYDIGQDVMMGVITDDLGVEYVQRHRIVKPGGP
jgi:hypothetical protein